MRPGSERGVRVSCLAAFLILAAAGAPGTWAQIAASAGALRPASPLWFESGEGRSPIEYSARSASYSLFLSRDEADVVLHGGQAPSAEVGRGKLVVVRAYARLLRMRFVDGNPPTAIAGIGKGPGRSYSGVNYRGIYAGTDLLIAADTQGMRFRLNLDPGADCAHIALEIAGATSIELERDGRAVVHAGRRSLLLARPILRFRGSRPVRGAYQIEPGNRLRFIVSRPALETGRALAD